MKSISIKRSVTTLTVEFTLDEMIAIYAALAKSTHRDIREFADVNELPLSKSYCADDLYDSVDELVKEAI
jgi:hypothetical protein